MNDLFGNGAAQLGLDLGDATPAPSCTPDRDDIRAELVTILATARAARDGSPWDRRTFLYHRTVFPQMAQWLEEDERNQLCFDFAQEVERIERLLAA